MRFLSTDRCGFVALGLAVLFVAPAGHAELRDCPSIGRGPDYKVVLGDVSAAPSAAADVETIRQRLIAKLKTSEEALRLNNERRKLATALCPGRQPRDDTEFDRRTVDDLNGLNVVLEIWGSITPSPGVARRQQAQINFALISLLKFEPGLDGIVDVAFPRGSAGSTDALTDLLLSDGVELRAVTALAVAMRLHKDGRYDAAEGAYCEAHTHLIAATRQAAAETAAPWNALRDFALASAGKVIAEARSDAEYSGPLKLLPATQQACSLPSR